jgi:hypothetical protein
MVFLLTVFLDSTDFEQPTAYDTFSESIREVLEVFQSGTTEEKEDFAQVLEWWVHRVVNTNTSDSEGTHWVLTSTYTAAPGSTTPQLVQVVVNEPLNGQQLCDPLITSLESVIGHTAVIMNTRSVQKDGWTCGYIVLFWILVLINQPEITFDETSPMPVQPADWIECVHAILPIRDKNVSSDKASAQDIKLKFMFESEDGFPLDALQQIADLFNRSSNRRSSRKRARSSKLD